MAEFEQGNLSDWFWSRFLAAKELQEKSSYKPIWIYYRLVEERDLTLEELEFLAKFFNYRPGWAKWKVSEQCDDRQNSANKWKSHEHVWEKTEEDEKAKKDRWQRQKDNARKEQKQREQKSSSWSSSWDDIRGRKSAYSGNTRVSEAAAFMRVKWFLCGQC